jgi:site-specific DNA recombinase
VRILDIYTRVSHKSDKRILSTAGQEARCRERVERTGAELGEVFTDPARSAWNPKVHRPGWEALMARLEAGESDGVVVFDLPRFAPRSALMGARFGVVPIASSFFDKVRPDTLSLWAR